MHWDSLIIGLVVGTLLGAALFVRGSIRRTTERRRTRAAAKRGYAAEADAPKMLKAAGYTVIESHPQATYTWWLDDEEQTSTIRPDWLVERDGLIWVVEVKSGARSNPRSRNTRRQLLEYQIYYPADGLLVIDAELDEIHTVEFPTPAPTSPLGFSAGLLVGSLLCASLLTAYWIIGR